MLNLRIKDKEKESSYQMGTIVSRMPSSLVTEQFRTIRTNIQFSMVDKSIRSFIVTSARSGAGKSTIAANLSTVLVNKNKRVLLVDADLRRPTVHRIFGLLNNQGLTNLLTDEESSLKDYVRCHSESGLHILTSGAIPHNPAELLGSNRMKYIINKMKHEFDIIVFDMPPVLPVTDAQILAAEVDGVVFVVPFGELTNEEALKSKLSLEKVNAKIIGAVINRTKERAKNDFYRY